MAKKPKPGDRTEVKAMIDKLLDDLKADPEKAIRCIAAIRDAEERLTEEELSYDEARKACRDAKKRMDSVRGELRRVTKYGPDPQQGLPFAEGDQQPADLDPDSAAAVASYNKKKSRSVEATKKRGAKKKTAKDDCPI